MVTDRLFRALAPLPRVQRFAARVVRRLPRRMRPIAHRGATLLVDPTEHSGYYLYYCRSYDDHVFSFLDARIGNYRRALDIGANIGLYATYFGARVARVEAFEPDPRVAAQLRGNLARNALGHVVVHECCIGRGAGVVRFAAGTRTNSGIGHVLPDAETAPPGAQLSSLPVTSLDLLLGGPLSEPTIVKMDIEGAEWDALHGARQSFGGASAPIGLLLETHPQQVAAAGGSMPALAALLEGMGFRVAALRDDAGLPRLAPLAPDDDRFWWAERP